MRRSCLSGGVMIRAGICGAGFIAAAHARAYAALSHVQLTAVADPRPGKADQLAQRYGASAVASLEELLDAGVDMISICTPTPTHAELATAAIRAGKHVLCEKPIARTVAEAEAMLAAASETG